ncbi:hypothetical protein SAMN05421737_104100 [Shouchella lonarensis]|uniref:Uncharacterized protein n=1 Tax=Shouchella lonarensis TaxID=1464122 RepID=A0A1G6HNM0_9BACI|nr:hypothetical protein SAMN05421737_104100 [Shouchella lonarensis]
MKRVLCVVVMAICLTVGMGTSGDVQVTGGGVPVTTN